jgi:hypothetical protein
VAVRAGVAGGRWSAETNRTGGRLRKFPTIPHYSRVNTTYGRPTEEIATHKLSCTVVSVWRFVIAAAHS